MVTMQKVPIAILVTSTARMLCWRGNSCCHFSTEPTSGRCMKPTRLHASLQHYEIWEYCQSTTKVQA